MDTLALNLTLYSNTLLLGKYGSNMQIMSLRKKRASTQLWVRWQLRCNTLYSETTPSIQVSIHVSICDPQEANYDVTPSLQNIDDTLDRFKINWYLFQKFKINPPCQKKSVCYAYEIILPFGKKVIR